MGKSTKRQIKCNILNINPLPPPPSIWSSAIPPTTRHNIRADQSFLSAHRTEVFCDQAWPAMEGSSYGGYCTRAWSFCTGPPQGSCASSARWTQVSQQIVFFNNGKCELLLIINVKSQHSTICTTRWKKCHNKGRENDLKRNSLKIAKPEQDKKQYNKLRLQNCLLPP
jgi:hypothetical protein